MLRPKTGRKITLSGRNTYNFGEPVTITGVLTSWPTGARGISIDGKQTSIATWDVIEWRYVA